MAQKKRLVGHESQQPLLPKNYCFACGPDNPEGLRLKFRFDESARRVRCSFRLPRRYWGPPKHAHGGIIATILDETMGKVNKLRQVVAVTSEMTVRYRRLVPLGKPLLAEGWEVRVRGREHTNAAEIRNPSGEVLASSRGKFIAIDAERMFGRMLRRPKKSGAARTAERRPRNQG